MAYWSYYGPGMIAFFCTIIDVICFTLIRSPPTMWWRLIVLVLSIVVIIIIIIIIIQQFADVNALQLPIFIQFSQFFF